MYSGRLKRRMWFETAQRLRYTLTRFHGDRFDVEAWTRHEWNMIIEPTGPTRRSPGSSPAAGDEPGDRLVVDRPQRVAGRRGVVPSVEHAELVAAGDEHQRAVELVHLVQEDRHVHRPRLGHLVVVEPRAEVLVPLPHVAVEGHLAVDLELVHVDRLAEDLGDRLDHPRMAREPRERRAVHVAGEVRPPGVPALFAGLS